MCNLRFLALLAWCLCADTLVHNTVLAHADPPPRLPPIPGNDDFANRTPLVGEPLAQPVYMTGASFEPFESGWTWFGSEAGSVWWSWVAPRSGAVTITLLDEVSRAGGIPGATPDVQSACGIAVLEGNTQAELTIDAQVYGYRYPLFSQVTFQAVGGRTYQVQVTSENAPNAAFVLRLAYDLAPEIVLSQPLLDAQFLAGEMIPFAARCLDPDDAISNVWFRVTSQYNERPQTWWIARPPFATNWSTAIPARYRLQAIVEDASGALREAVPVEFDVRPVNDAFANRTPLAGDAIDITAWVQNATHEPFAFGAANWADVWWRWTAPKTGPFTLVVDDTPGYYPRVDVFTGSTLPTLITVASNAFNGWFGVPYETSVTFDAVAGIEYAIEVPSSARCTLHGVYSRPPQVEILAPLNNPTVMTPEPVTLEVNATDPDDGIARVEFWLDDGLVGTITNAPYRFVYDTSHEWGLQRRFTARAVDHYGLTTVSTSEYFTIVPQPDPPPANDNFANRTPLPAAFTNQPGSTYLASREPGEPGSGGASVWWSWTASQSGYHTILLQALPGYSLTAYRGNSLDNLELLATSRQTTLVQNPFGPHQIEFWESELLLNAEAGTTYALSVARGVDDPFGTSFLLSLIQGARPAITGSISPAELTVIEGVPITITAQPSDLDGSIRDVQFTLYGFVETNIVLTQPPYEITLTNLLPNGYGCVATATDDQGLISAPLWFRFNVQSPPPEPPPGDLFAGRIPITGARVTRTGSIENSRSGCIWYEWTAPSTRTFTVTLTSEVGRYPNLYIWQGTDETNLTEIADYRYAGTDKELDYTARILLEATEGQIYILQLNAGSFGAGYTLDIQDSLPPSVRIVFPRLTDTIRGKDSFLITASATDPDGTIARVECFYDFTSIGVLTHPPYEWLVRIRDNMTMGHAIRVNAYDDHGLENLDIQNGVIVYPAPPPNDYFANATVIDGFAANAQGRLSGATIEDGEPGVTGGTDGLRASAWFAWRAPANGTVILAMQCAETVLDVYAAPTPDADFARLQPIPLQGSYSATSGLHQRAWRTVAGVDYRIAIRAKAFNFAQYDLRLLLVPDRAGSLAIGLPHAGSTQDVALEASGLPGARTVIETSVDLIHWEPIGEGNGTTFEFLHQPAPTGTSRFYRTVTWP